MDVQIDRDMRQERQNRLTRMRALEFFSHRESLVTIPTLGEIVDGVIAQYMPAMFAWFFYKFDQVRCRLARARAHVVPCDCLSAHP